MCKPVNYSEIQSPSSSHTTGTQITLNVRDLNSVDVRAEMHLYDIVNGAMDAAEFFLQSGNGSVFFGNKVPFIGLSTSLLSDYLFGY